MANLENTAITAIKVNSEVLTKGELEEKRQKVKKWQDYGYAKMTIVHFLAEEVNSLSLTFEEDNYVINLG